jgi:5-methylcytosine-specific restriction protein A
MVLFKASTATIEGILKNEKHAFRTKIAAKAGELILLQLTKTSITDGNKSIRWIMEFIDTYEDLDNETDKIWGKHWPFIVRVQNVRHIEAFDITDLQVTKKSYGKAMGYTWIDSEDEDAILEWISDDEPLDISEMNLISSTPNVEQLIDILNEKYKGYPSYKAIISKKINRPSPLRDAIIQRDGTTCKICKKESFLKRNGKYYCEIHHMIELCKDAPDSLQSWNLLIVCPTCHKQLHYGNVHFKFLNPGWEILIDHTICRVT